MNKKNKKTTKKKRTTGPWIQTVPFVKSNPYETKPPAACTLVGDQFDARVFRVVSLQAPDGSWGWHAFPGDTSLCWGWNAKRCAEVVRELLSELDIVPGETALATLCVVLKIEQGYPRQYYLIPDARKRALRWLSRALAVRFGTLEGLIKHAKICLRNEPICIRDDGRDYEREPQGVWIDTTTGLRAPKAAALRLEKKLTSG